jgi:hypothetical protein
VYFDVIQGVSLSREMVESHTPGGDVSRTPEEEPVKAAGRFRTALPQVRVG